MYDWKLVVFNQGDPHPTTYTVPGRQMDDYKPIVYRLCEGMGAEVPNMAWAELTRECAHYTELGFCTMVLIKD